MSFVPGQGEDGAALRHRIPPGAAGAVTLPADILHAGRLAISAALYRANPQYCVQIGRLSSFERAQLPARESVIVDSHWRIFSHSRLIVDGICAIVAIPPPPQTRRSALQAAFGRESRRGVDLVSGRPLADPSCRNSSLP